MELLVVFVIIGVLAALSVPALTRSRDRARETVCLNNFRQIGIGLKLYQGDNQNRYPLGGTLTPNPGTLDPRYTRLDQVWDFTRAIGGKDVKDPLPTVPPAVVRPLNRYVNEPRSFRCPSDGGIDFRANDGPHWKTLWETFGCSYQYNAPWWVVDNSAPRSWLSGRDDSSVSQASRFIVLYEPPARRQSWRTQGFYVYWHRSHPAKTINGSRNRVEDGRLISPLLFADGHASIADFTDEAGYGTNSDRWIWSQD